MKSNCKLFSALTLFILFFSLTLSSQVRQVRNLDPVWKFIQEDVPGAEKPLFNDKAWRSVDLPHDWSIEHAFSESIPYGHRVGYLPYGIGWYRKNLAVTKKDLGRSVWIEFDGIYMNSDVWINGQHLGHYANGYISLDYLLTPYLKEGNNVIAVRVDNSAQPNSRWYTGSGIYRHVRLVIASPVHIPYSGIYITTPKIEAEKAEVLVRTKIENSSGSLKDGTVLSVVLDRSGKEVARMETPFNIEKDKVKEISQSIEVSNPELWSVESPAIYSLKSFVREKGKTVDDTQTSFGIRSLEFDAVKGFLLNGKQVKMNGVNLHHDGGCVGAAVPEAVWIRRLKVLREMGCNAIRTSHNPVAPEFLDICDSLGFLVMNEVFDEWKESKGSGKDVVTKGYHIYFDEWCVKDLTRTIHRDRNHPSVVLWSVGNEVPDQVTPNGHETLRMLSDICHAEDPTRPVTQGCDRIAAESGGSATIDFLNGLDIVGYNYVDRWRIRRELYFTIDKMAHPGWKMIGTESSSVRGVRGEYSLGKEEGKVTADYLNFMINPAEQWKYIATHDFVMGDFMWTGIDYIGEAGWPNVNSSAGAIDRCGFPKDGFYFYQSRWTKDPMIHLFPHWNWSGREGQFIPVVCFTNCDAVELFLNGKSIGEKRIEFPRQGMAVSYQRYERPQVRPTTSDLHLTWDVPYEAGTLKAVGKIQGEVVFTREIHTSGEPYAIKLTADKNKVSTESWDVVHIQAEVTDKNGNVVPYAGNLLKFSIEGPGKLAGVDNGNPRDHTSFRLSEKQAFNGMCLALVKAINKGEIRITVESDNLKENTLVLQTR